MIGSVARALLVLSLCVAPAAAKPAACPDGRFLLPDGTWLLAPSAIGRQGVSLAAKTLGLDGSCDATKARVKAGKRATRVVARWRACGDRTRVVLKATIAAPDCGTLRGRVKARKTPAVAFDATRSACGDGYADVAGGETCDGAADDLSVELLIAAHDAIAGGATDVPLSPDGTLRFVRTTTSTGGTDAIVRGATTLVRWVHDGDVTTMTADQDGDGTPELQAEATRAPARAAIVHVDLDDDGVAERSVSMTQVAADGVEVEIADEGQPPVGFTASLLQEAGGSGVGNASLVSGENCSADQVTEAETTLVDALGTGLACLKRLGMDSIGKTIGGKVLKDGVVFRCGATDACAQVDIVDSLTHGVLPTTLGLNLGPKFFTGEGSCGNESMVLFHELLHMGFGDWHAPALDRSDKASLAADRVYSCTDMCFRPGEVSKRSCATCLGVDRCDAKCDAYADLPGDAPCGPRVEIATVSCPSQACSCCPDCPPGVKFQERATGEASAPEGYSLRVNFLQTLGGDLTCGSWSKAPCALSAFDLLCCRREPGQPATTTFVATLPFPFQDICVCPVPPPLDAGNVVAQVVSPENDAIVEATEPITCP